jgi:hypothetical protein
MIADERNVWAKSMSKIFKNAQTIVAERNIEWVDFLLASLNTYKNAVKNCEEGKVFAQLDRAVIAYMTAHLFSGEDDDPTSEGREEWFYQEDKLLNRNVVRIVGLEDSCEPSEFLGEFVASKNAYSMDGDSLADKNALLFADKMIEITNKKFNKPSPFVDWAGCAYE